jgi:signal transduction histidine kinase
MQRQPWKSSAERTSLLLGALTVAVGAVVLVGWYFDIDLLKRGASGVVAMSPLAAVAFAAAGSSLLLLRCELRLTIRRKLLGFAFATLALLVGLLKIASILNAGGYALAQWLLVSRFASSQAGYLNTMAPNTAFDFVLIACALLCIDMETKRRHRPAEVLALVCSISALLAVLGYAYNVSGFYQIGHHTPMALSTAATFLVLSFGILLARYDKGMTGIVASDTAGGFLARRLLPIAILLPILLGVLHVFAQRARLFDDGFSAALYGTVVVFVFVCAIWWTTRLLFDLDIERKAVTDALRQSRDELEERVHARTRELEQTNAALLDQVAARERTAAALNSSQEQLLQAQKMEVLGQLAGGIAHDFNNILTAIMGYGTVLLAQVAAEERDESHIAEILRAAQRAAGLSKQLLGFSRHDPYEPTVLSVGGVVRAVEKMLRQVIGDRIILRTDISADAGAIEADSGQLEQVLLNLAINARDAMPSGGTITIAARRTVLRPGEVKIETDARDFVALSVRDEGTGIPADVLPRIFEPFFTTKRAGQGTGLGLATCRAIADRSGGWIACDSEPGKGTVFTIFLPRVAEEERSTDTRRQLNGALPTGTETVLVVEDEPMVGELVALLLKNLGYDVVQAEDGQQAEEALDARDRQIDLVLTDLNMPRMDGRELVRRLSRVNPDLKVILTSGNDVDDLDDETDIAFNFMPKPFTLPTLAQKIREVLDNGAAR